MFQRLFLGRVPTLDQLRCLLKVEQAGGITAAAGGDRKTAVGFQQQLDALEDFLGAPVRERAGRGIVLTEAGLSLARIAREMLGALEDLKAQSQNRTSEIVIGGGGTLFHWIVLPALSRLTGTSSRTEFRIKGMKSRDVGLRLLDESIDFGIVRESALAPQLDRRRVCRLHFDICVPRGSLPSDWSSMPEEALAAAVFRAMPLAVYWGESEFNRALADLANLLGVELDARVKCESFLEAARMLQLGRVAAILPDLASQELDRVRFHVFGRDLLKHAQRTIVLAWNKRNLEVRPSLARAKNHLLHAIAESLARGPESKPESQSTGRD